MRRPPAVLGTLAISALLSLMRPTESAAASWPDAAARVERDAAATSAEVRRSGVRGSQDLGVDRARPIVLRALGDDDIEVRLAAVTVAVRLRLGEVTDVVLPWLGERDARLRMAACDLLRAMPSPRAAQPLARALGDVDPQVRAGAAAALGVAAASDAVPPLLGRLDDGSPPVRVEVVRSLAKIGDARAVVPLVGKVQDSSVEMRQAVARALGELRDARATQALVMLLRDANQDVRLEALGALGRLRAKEAVDSIIPMRNERAPAVRHAALAALGRIGGTPAIRALTAVLGQAEDGSALVERTPVREALLTAGVEIVPILLEELGRAPSSAAATSIAWLLGELRAEAAGPAVVRALRAGTLPSAPALVALGRLAKRGRSGAAADLLTTVLEYVADPNPLVRSAARDAADLLLDPRKPDGRAVEPLTSALARAPRSSDEVPQLVMLLGKTGAARVVPTIAPYTTSPSLSLRRASYRALGHLPVGSADKELVRGLSDEVSSARLDAALALEREGGPIASRVLTTSLTSSSELDRFAAYVALRGILARIPDEAATALLVDRYGLAGAPERDAIAEILATAKSPRALAVLGAQATSTNPSERRGAALALGGQATDAAEAILASLTKDTDATVRSAAAWSIGTSAVIRASSAGANGDASGSTTPPRAPLSAAAVRALENALGDGASAVSANAAGALARGFGVRVVTSSVGLIRALCSKLGDAADADVRTNAMVALAVIRTRCGDGSAERARLRDGTTDEERAAAARLVLVGPTEKDRGELERCEARDASARVADACSGATMDAKDARAATVFVTGGASVRPAPEAAAVLGYEEGLVRRAVTDRRGAVYEALAPRGTVEMLSPR